MSLPNRLKSSFLVVGDVLTLYVALFAALFIRYGNDFYRQFTERHSFPFAIVFGIWILVFYISGLYDLRKLHNNIEFLKILGLAIFVNALISIIIFYLVPFFGIAPKTNLFIFLFCFGVLEVFWRRLFNRVVSSKEADTKILLIGDSLIAQQIYDETKRSPQLGYSVKQWLKDESVMVDSRALRLMVAANDINLIAVPRRLKNNDASTKYLYELLCLGIEIYDLPNLFEAVFRKVPLQEVDEGWFLENITDQHRFYDDLKRAGEFFAAVLLAVVLSPLLILLALMVKLASPGPVILKQERVGKNGKRFTMYKFRYMKALSPDGSAEINGAQWKTTGAADPRFAPMGKFLTITHLDELPQLLNIMKGDLSFVGPRPERQEFVNILKEKVPYYEIRHLVNPGIAGWAQLNYRYGASVEDAYEKLQYDIYYLQNRSAILDLAIIIKTIRSFFINQK